MTIKTLAEVAAELKVAERWLREFIRRRQIGVLRSGRIIRFDDAAMRELHEAMRARYAPPVRARPGLPARSAASAYEDVIELTATMLKKKRPR